MITADGNVVVQALVALEYVGCTECPSLHEDSDELENSGSPTPSSFDMQPLWIDILLWGVGFATIGLLASLFCIVRYGRYSDTFQQHVDLGNAHNAHSADSFDHEQLRFDPHECFAIYEASGWGLFFVGCFANGRSVHGKACYLFGGGGAVVVPYIDFLFLALGK